MRRKVLFRKKNQEVETVQKPASPGPTIDDTILIVSALPDPVLILDDQRVVKHVNQAALDLFGRSLVGRNIVQCLRQPHVIDAVERVFKTKKNWVGDVKFPEPVRRHLTLHVGLIGDGKGVAITVRDTTLMKRTEEMHSDFVANVSHELRSPLSALMGFIETLQGPAQNDPDARDRFLGIMIQEANRMARLIDDLLSLSRVEIQEHVVPDETVDVKLTLQNIMDILSLRAKNKNMKMVLDCNGDDYQVSGDSDQMTQVFQNLIDNAIKYGREATEVRISCKKLDRMPNRNIPGLEISIADQGDGIEQSHIPRLTERFYRIDKARSRTLGGTGLGLAIAKHIIARHRGRLQIDSVVGAGSTFTVLLPIKVKN
jgi:two-component system phosphate regulon sensor histidine kinase PhoR